MREGAALRGKAVAAAMPCHIAVAAIGLVNMAIDSFASMTVPSGPNPLSTKVGPYIVSDFGSLLSTVTTPEGQTYRCTTVIFPEEGAGIQCKKS